MCAVTVCYSYVYVAVNFFLQLNVILPLFLGMVMYDSEFKTKEESNILTEEKPNYMHCGELANCHQGRALRKITRSPKVSN